MVSSLTRHDHLGRAARPLAAAARKGLRALPEEPQVGRPGTWPPQGQTARKGPSTELRGALRALPGI